MHQERPTPFIPPRPSTREFIREARRLPNYSVFDWLHGYVYSRWPYLYISVGTGEHRLSPIFQRVAGWVGRMMPKHAADKNEADQVTIADTYHGKVVTLESAKKLVTVNQPIKLENLEPVIPYKLAKDIVLNNPDHITILDCPCRVARPDPCLPLDVCMIIGEPFASFIREHHSDRSRWITADEAVEILREEHERGHVHHAFFKDAMLGRFYAICNCCSCCCGAMQAQRTGIPMLTASGYISKVDPVLCGGCGTCVDACQFEAISIIDDKSVVDEAACMGCGVCVDLCPQDAMTLPRDESKGIPLELDVLMAEAMAEQMA
jgi:ferredoxin